MNFDLDDELRSGDESCSEGPRTGSPRPRPPMSRYPNRKPKLLHQGIKSLGIQKPASTRADLRSAEANRPQGRPNGKIGNDEKALLSREILLECFPYGWH